MADVHEHDTRTKNNLFLTGCKFAVAHASCYNQGLVSFNVLLIEVKFLSLLSFKDVMKGFIVNGCLYCINHFKKRVRNIQLVNNNT